MSYTDPSGYNFFKSAYKTLSKLDGRYYSHKNVFSRNQYLNMAHQIGLSFIPGFGMLAGAHSTFDSVYFGTGNFRAAMRAGATQYASNFAIKSIGSHYQDQSGSGNIYFGGNYLTAGQVAGQIAAHAIVGGVTASLQGGKFGHGFFSAGVTKGAGGAWLPGGGDLGAGDVAYGTVVSAVIGGTASVISGGKFVNGAQTAAFQYLFNQVKSGIPNWFDSDHQEIPVDYLDYEWTTEKMFRLDFPGEFNYTIEGQLPALRGPMGMPIGPGVEAKWYHTRLIKDTLDNWGQR